MSCRSNQSCCLSTGRIRHRAAPGNRVSRVDPDQPDQSGPTVQACVSTRNQKATPWGVALIGGILIPGPGLEPGTSGLTVRGL